MTGVQTCALPIYVKKKNIKMKEMVGGKCYMVGGYWITIEKNNGLGASIIVHHPSSKYLVPSTRCHILGTKYLVPYTLPPLPPPAAPRRPRRGGEGGGGSVYDTKYLVPSTWYQVLGTRYLDDGR